MKCVEVYFLRLFASLDPTLKQLQRYYKVFIFQRKLLKKLHFNTKNIRTLKKSCPFNDIVASNKVWMIGA